MSRIRSFVVRIYRSDTRTLTGLVEDVENASTASFRSMAELWSLLRQPALGRKRGPHRGKASPPDAAT